MIIWIMYDIEKDKARTKVAKYCKQAGLYRVQYSVFLGKMNKSEKDTLALMIEDLIDPLVDKVYMFAMGQNELKQCLMLGQAFDKKLVTDEVKALFF